MGGMGNCCYASKETASSPLTPGFTPRASAAFETATTGFLSISAYEPTPVTMANASPSLFAVSRFRYPQASIPQPPRIINIEVFAVFTV